MFGKIYGISGYSTSKQQSVYWTCLWNSYSYMNDEHCMCFECFDSVYFISILHRRTFFRRSFHFPFGIERHCKCVKYSVFFFVYLFVFLLLLSLSILPRLTLEMHCDCNLHTAISIACGMNVCIFCYCFLFGNKT